MAQPSVASASAAPREPALLTGVQAVARLLIEQHARDRRAGLRTATFVSGYRGSPLGGLDQVIAAIPGLLDVHDIHLTPGLNEELGATAVWGSQVPLPSQGLTRDGVVGVWYGKAPGVDRAGDAIRHGNLSGAHPRGGVLVLAGDDPAAKSSTLPSASERTLASYSLPVLYPSTGEDLIRLGLYGVALSRVTGLWTGVKIVSDVADGIWSVSGDAADLDITVPRISWGGAPWEYRQAHAATVPWSREAERDLVGPRWDALLAFADANPLDVSECDPQGATLGIVAAGRVYDDTIQALSDLGLDRAAIRSAGIRLLRLALIYPLAPGRLRGFADGLRKVLVIEEKTPFIETQLRDLLYGMPAAPAVVGKRDEKGRSLVPAHGGLSAAEIAPALRRFLPARLAEPSRPRELVVLGELTAHRTSYFCSGCPHNRSTVVPEGSLAGGGIGCHAMTLRMPHTAGQMTGITQMGGEGAQWIGQAPFTSVQHLFQNMGDGTYFHSGQLSVQACVAAGVNITFKLLYNSAVAMTGGQEADGAIAVPALTHKLTAEGVRRIIVCAEDPAGYGRMAGFAAGVEVWHRDRLDEAQHVLRDTRGVTVLIYDQQCAAEARRQRRRGQAPARPQQVLINEAVCEGCGDCGAKSNCLSLQPVTTEFGRKTRIDQSSCNLDYSCLDGDCPAFLTAEVEPGVRSAALPDPPPAPAPMLPATWPYQILLAGIGGTGVVTANRVLAEAARSEGLHVAGLDQTGLSQKAGPVTSHLRLSSGPAEGANRVSGGVHTYLVFDPLAGAESELLAHCDPGRTIAVISQSVVPTGAQVREPGAPALGVAELTERIRPVVARTECVDSIAAARRLFGSTAPANLLLVGVAYQVGALPLQAESIEAAIAANGTAVSMNIAAFRWGRVLAHGCALPADVRTAAAADADRAAAADRRVGDALTARRRPTGETQRLSSVRAAHLVHYQNRRTALRYLDAVEAAWEAERAVTRRTEFSEAVARGLHHLIAYKDEYEVARLLTTPESRARLAAELGPVKGVRYRLHPPLLRALGRRRKVSLSRRWNPALKLLARGKVLRGTIFDPFGHTEVRRLERALSRHYAGMVANLSTQLTEASYDTAVAAAAAAEQVRGYEHLKIASARRFADRLAALGIEPPGIP